MSHVLLVGPHNPNGPNYHHWNSFLHGFEAAFSVHPDYVRGEWKKELASEHPEGGEIQVGGTRVPIKIIDTHEGEPDRDAAIAKLADYVRDETPAIVCGFVTSQATSDFLTYLRDRLKTNSTHWPAVILPMATSSDLLRRDHNPDGQLSEDRLPILRLVASNTAQITAMSERIADFEILGPTHGRNSVAIFRDGDNIAYARNLADAFRIEAEDRRVAVVLDTVFGSERGSVDLALLLHQPEYIVFFGMLNSAVPFIRQVKHFVKVHEESGPIFGAAEASNDINDQRRTWKPHIFVSDGSCRESLSEQFPRWDELNGVLGFFPNTRTNLSANHALTRPPWNRWLEGPSFFTVGHDAAIMIVDLIRHVIEREKQQPQPIHLAAAVHRAIKVSTTQAYSYFPNDRLLLSRYRFEKCGDVMGKTYESWLLEGGSWKRRTS